MYCSILNAHLPLAQSPPVSGIKPDVETLDDRGLGRRAPRHEVDPVGGDAGQVDDGVGHDDQPRLGHLGRGTARRPARYARRYRKLDPEPVQPTTKRCVTVAARARTARCRWPSIPAPRPVPPMRTSRPGSRCRPRRTRPGAPRPAWPVRARATSSQMASSTSKSTGRCSSGSRVRCPGRISRSSQVTSAAPRTGRGGQARRQLGPLQRRGGRRRQRTAAAERAGGTDAYFEMRGGRAETSMPSAAQGLDVLQDAEPARGRQPARHQRLDPKSTHGRRVDGDAVASASWPRRREAAAERRLHPLPGLGEPQRRQPVQARPGVLLVLARSRCPRPMRSRRLSSVRPASSSARLRSRRIGAP